MNRPAPWRRLGRLGLCAALGMLLGVGILFAGCYYVVPPPPPPYAAPAPPPGAILVPGQWVWNGAAWVWRPPLLGVAESRAAAGRRSRPRGLRLRPCLRPARRPRRGPRRRVSGEALAGAERVPGRCGTPEAAMLPRCRRVPIDTPRR